MRLRQQRAAMPPDEVASEEQLAELARQLGVPRRGPPAHALAAPPAATADEVLEFRLWPEHVPAARLFDACSTQWRHAGMDGAPTGLDYAGVRASAAFHRLPADQREQAMDDLQWIELGWLAEYRRRDEQRRRQPPKPPQHPPDDEGE